ncbi:MAG: GHMP family kinase ATP-binding protein [Promethearchaeota archaeon]
MRVRAPGRLCLFGEHQDYLGFPIIAAAINRYIFIEQIKQINNPVFHIEMPDIEDTLEIHVFTENDLKYSKKRDYLRSAYNILRRKGYNWGRNFGYDLKLTGNIPINAGASSSSAMVIAWLIFLSKIAKKNLSPEEIARLGYETEVLEFNEAGGMMDHFSSALGGVIFMETAPIKYYSFRGYKENFGKSFILIDSEQRKSTVKDLYTVKNRSLGSFKQIKKIYNSFDKYKTKISEIEPYLDSMNDDVRKVLLGCLENRDITREAFKILKKGEIGILSVPAKKKIGELFCKLHEILSEFLGVSTYKIDKIVKFCLKNGAYGAKINGSGFGGTLFAYCPNNREKLLKKLRNEGLTAYPIEISDGAKDY